MERHFSAFAGAVALAVIVLPVVVRTTEDMLSARCRTFAARGRPMRRSALPKLARHHDDHAEVAYRAAAAGMTTGVLLAVARVPPARRRPCSVTALNEPVLERRT